jgi:hypothetical protein
VDALGNRSGKPLRHPKATSAAKAAPWRGLMARLKPCPSTKLHLRGYWA